MSRPSPLKPTDIPEQVIQEYAQMMGVDTAEVVEILLELDAEIELEDHLDQGGRLS
jgi:hypothetical protein